MLWRYSLACLRRDFVQGLPCDSFLGSGTYRQMSGPMMMFSRLIVTLGDNRIRDSFM